MSERRTVGDARGPAAIIERSLFDLERQSSYGSGGAGWDPATITLELPGNLEGAGASLSTGNGVAVFTHRFACPWIDGATCNCWVEAGGEVRS